MNSRPLQRAGCQQMSTSEGLKADLGGEAKSTRNGMFHEVEVNLVEPLSTGVKVVPIQPLEVSSTRFGQNDEQEMSFVYDFLNRQTTKLFDELDEDSFVMRMVRIDQLAKQRVSLVPDLEADSEEEESRLVHGNAYKQEVAVITCQELCRDISRQAKSSNINVDKFISWLKKRMGVRRRRALMELVGPQWSSLSNHDVSCDSDNNNCEEIPSRRKRRLTRGMARHSRVRKREERTSATEFFGLQSLVASAKDLDIEEPLSNSDGVQSECKTRTSSASNGVSHIVTKQIKRLTENRLVAFDVRSREDEHRLMTNDASLNLSAFINGSKWSSKDGRSHNDQPQRIQVQITSIIVGGNNLEPIFRFDYKTSRDNFGKKRSHKKRPNPDQNFQEGRDMEHGRSKKMLRLQSSTQVPLLHPTVKNGKRKGQHSCRAPLEYRFTQRSATLLKANGAPFSEQLASGLSCPKILPPISIMSRDYKKFSSIALPFMDGRYPCWSSDLLDRLSGGCLPFTTHEYFYSDIDRPWFNYDWYREDFARKGISLDSCKSKREWRLIRQQVLSRPRRFSRRFISDEMRQLEDYRSTVRCLQHTGLPRPVGFPFEVARPLKIGATGTAFSRETGCLGRCVVLSYDFANSLYHVRFDAKEEGNAVCLDTEIATDGLPELLFDLEPVITDEAENDNCASDDELQVAHGKR